MRLFVAVSPPPAVVDALFSLDRPAVEGLRWTTRDQWHVTLRFLGEVATPGPVVDALGTVPGALSGTRALPVQAHMGPASAWFAGRQVLQLPVAGLGAVADAVALATAPWGEEADARSFVGHLTLARVRGRKRGPVRLAGVAIEASWAVEEFALVSSVLAPGGSRYRIEHAWPLG